MEEKKEQLGSKPIKSVEEQIAELKSIKDKEVQSWKDKHSRAEERLASLEDEIADLKTRNADPDDIEALRKNHVEIVKENRQLKQRLDTAEGEAKSLKWEGAIEKIAKEFGVDAELLRGCADEKEARILAREKRLEIKESEPKVPEKGRVEIGAGTGTGVKALADLSPSERIVAVDKKLREQK